VNGRTQAEAVLIGQVIASQEGQRLDLEGYGPPLAESETAQAGRLGFVVGLAPWLRRTGVDAETPLSVLTPPGPRTVMLPPGCTPIADE
jgi:hypothetical protein